jgi:hypothetical protein
MYHSYYLGGTKNYFSDKVNNDWYLFWMIGRIE